MRKPDCRYQGVLPFVGIRFWIRPLASWKEEFTEARFQIYHAEAMYFSS